MCFKTLLVLSCLIYQNIATLTENNNNESEISDYWPGNFRVFPILPMAAPHSSNRICRNESEYVIKNLFNLTTWAYQMWDASAKSVAGQAAGSVHNFGNFDECLAIKGPIETQYCLVEINVDATPTKQIDKHIDKYEPYEHLANRLHYTNVRQKMRRNRAFWGLCVPKSCSNKEMEIAINGYLKLYSESSSVNNLSFSVSIDSDLCQTADRKYDSYSAADIIFCILLAVLALLVFIGSAVSECYEITESKNIDEPLIMQLFKAFSLRRTVNSLMDDTSFPRLEALYGLRLFSIVLVVSGHIVSFKIIAGPIDNKQFRYDLYVSWFYTPLIHGDVIVDSFFFLGGILMTVRLLGIFEIKNINSFKIIFLRYMRLTPLYALTIFYYTTLYEKFGSGPYWKKYVEQEATFCRENWWTNLLYISNYVNKNRMCMYQSWYLPCDFHFFIVGLFTLRVLKKNRRTGLSLIVALIILSLLVLFLTVFLGNKQAVPMAYEDLYETLRDDDFISTVYTPSHLRSSPYLVGILLGYIFYKMKDSTFKLKKVTASALSILGMAIMYASIVPAIIFYTPGEEYNALESATYATLSRFSWAVGLGLLTFALGFGEVPLLGATFRWKLFIPLSKLAYGVYILHLSFLYQSHGELRHANYGSLYSAVRMSIPDIGISFLLALVTYFAIESPVRNVMITILNRFSQQSVKEIININETVIMNSEATPKQNGML